MGGGMVMVLDASLSIPAEDCGWGDLVVQPATYGLEADAERYRSLRTTLVTIATDTRTTVNDTSAFWTGTDSDGFRRSGRQRAAKINSIVAPLDKIIGAYETLIDALAVLQEKANDTLDTGDAVVGVEPCSTARGSWASSANDNATWSMIDSLFPVHTCGLCDDWYNVNTGDSCEKAKADRITALKTTVESINSARGKLTDYRADAVLARQAFQTSAESALADLALPVPEDWGNPEPGIPPLEPPPVDPALPPVPPAPPEGGGGDGGGGGGGGNGGGGRGGGGGVPAMPSMPTIPEPLELAPLEPPVELDAVLPEDVPAGVDDPTAPSVDGAVTGQVQPPELRWIEDQLAARDIVDGRWSVSDDPAFTEYMLSDPAFSARVEAGSLSAATEAVQRYLQTGASDGTFTTFPAETAPAADGAAPAPVPAAAPAGPLFGDRLGALPQATLEGTAAAPVATSVPGELDHSGSSGVVALGDGRFAVTVEVEHTWSDRIELDETFPPGSWQDGAREVLMRGIDEPYDLAVTWGETRTVILDAQGHVYTLEPVPVTSGR